MLFKELICIQSLYLNTAGNYIIIKTASTDADYKAAKELFLEYQQELGINLCFQNFEEELLQLPLMYGGKNGSLLLALSGVNYIGCVAIRKKENEICEMKRLFIKPSYKNQGIGRKLVNQIIAEAIRLGYKKMILDTLERLSPAIHLYKNFGFKETSAYYKNPLEGVIYLEREL
jgi:GNAT superfamily N-acetyltransferase